MVKFVLKKIIGKIKEHLGKESVLYVKGPGWRPLHQSWKRDFGLGL